MGDPKALLWPFLRDLIDHWPALVESDPDSATYDDADPTDPANR